MTSDDAFLAAICASPDDMAPRQMYADWLMERGDPRGEFIRDALADPHGEQYTAPADMARHYRPLAGWDGWPAGVTWTVQVRRGFVEWISCGTTDWFVHGPALVRIAPLQSVVIANKHPRPHHWSPPFGPFRWVQREPWRWRNRPQPPESPHELPPEWFRLLKGDKPGYWHYDTEEAADADLSRVALEWAHAVGVPVSG